MIMPFSRRNSKKHITDEAVYDNRRTFMKTAVGMSAVSGFTILDTR